MCVCCAVDDARPVVVHDVFASFFFFQAEDGIRDLVRSRGLGDVYKRQRATGLQITDSMPCASWRCLPLQGLPSSDFEGDGLSLIHI